MDGDALAPGDAFERALARWSSARAGASTRGATRAVDAEDGLGEMMRAGRWRAIAERGDGGASDEGEGAWAFARALAMVRSGRAREAGEAAGGWLGADGAGVARDALRAEIALASGDAENGLDLLCELRERCVEGERAGGVEGETWRRRRRATERAVARRYLMAENPRAALIWIDAMARDEPKEPEHLSTAGRAHLMMGDLEGARLCFNAAEKLTAALGEAASEEQRARVLRDRGDYFFAGAKYAEARAAYGAALLKNENDVAAKVNAAVAAVYAGDLDSSRVILENGLVAAADAPAGSPARGIITPSAVKNLQSIYELTARAPAESKLSMNTFIKSIAPEDFDFACMTA